MLVGSGRYAGLPQLISTTRIYVFPPRAPTLEAGFIIKPQLSHRDTQEAVGIADSKNPRTFNPARHVNSMIDLYRTCGHAARARRCPRRQLEWPPPRPLWPGCDLR